MTNALAQLILTVLMLVALVVLIETGHSSDQNTAVIAAGLGIAIGFFFRSTISAYNNSKDNTNGQQ